MNLVCSSHHIAVSHETLARSLEVQTGLYLVGPIWQMSAQEARCHSFAGINCYVL